MTSIPANVPAHSGASPTRDPAFSLQDFGALVSSALDVQRIPDSTLAFSLDPNTHLSPQSFLPPKNGQSTRQYASDTFKKLKGALKRRKDQQDASKDALRTRPPLLSETRHLTSSSVPVLSEIEPSRLKRVHASTSLANLRIYEDGRFDSNMSYIAAPASPGETYGSGTFRLPTNVPSWSRHDLRNHANEHAFSEIPRDAQNSRSFLSLKPLIIPSLTKKSSRLLFSSGSPPSDQITSPRSAGSPQDDSGAMSSFFDDSGYADDALPAYKVVRETSRPGLRSLFSSSTLNSELRSQSRYNISARKWEDKALPPPPTEGQPSTQIHQADRTSRTFTGRNEAQRQEMGDKHAVASLFYTSPSHRKAPRRPIHNRLSAHIVASHKIIAHGPSKRVAPSSNTQKVRGKLHGNSRRPPPYPSPTSPLPPTPDLLPVGLPAVSPANSDHYHATDGDASRRSNEGSERSVDSMEILSWRMPVLEQRISKNSTSSAGHAHACGRPSRGSIRERLGLGPRLHLHVPLPTQDVSQPHPYAKSRSASLSPYKHNKTFSCLTTVRPVPGKVSSSPKRSVSRLASASLVSLRSITTITAPSKDIYDEDADSDRRDALGVDRAFTPEDDPFAAIAPSPVSPLFYTHIPIKNTKLRSFMPLGNNTTVSVGKAVPETPMSAPATLTSFQSHCDLRSTSSSPALTASSSIEISMQSPLINEARVASPSSVNSGLPPSLVEALRQTPSSPPVSDYLNIPRHNLSHVLAQTRKVQGARKASSKSKLNGNGEGNSHRVVGHTDSRPNSPFPMIFLKSVAAKASSAALKKNKRESILSSQSEMTEERSNKGELVAAVAEAETTPQPYTSKPSVECPIQGLVCEPLPLGANDADAFGEACRAEVKRDIMSPTAWFLDEDCTRDTEVANNNIDSSTLGPEPGEGEVHADALMKETVGEEDIDQPAPPQLFRESLHKAYPETDSETDTENECGPSDSRSWPLPPPRTVMVNEENGESWHTVEPIVEYVKPNGAVPISPRHSVRFPRSSVAASTRSRNSRRSSSGSPSPRKLSTRRARLIAEKLNCGVSQSYIFADAPVVGLAVQHRPQTLARQRAHSTTSITSALTTITGARSLRTCKSAYYSVHSMPIASNSASPSSSRSRLSATSSNSSPSGHAEQLTGPTTKRNSNERPETRISEEDCFAQSAQTDVFLSSHRTGKTRTMPQRIVLREDAPTSTFTVLTVGWELLLVFCSQNAATRIEAEGGDEGKLLCVSLEEGDGAVITNSAEAPALRLFRPERSNEFAPSMPGCSLPPPSFSAANVFVKLTLSLGSANFGEYRTPNMAFILPLPTTFEKIAEYSTRVRSGRA